MFKISLPLPGTSSEKDQTAGFSSLLLLTGLSVAAGSLLYSATNRSINMKSMLQTSHYRASRDSIANSIRATVGVPNLLKHSASLDSSSALNSCLDTTQTNQCLALDGSGNPVPHDLKVYDAQGQQLTGTAASPVYYDAQTGALCGTAAMLAENPCELQATSTFTVSCGGVANCQGSPLANISIDFKVELRPSVPTLPDGTMLKPFNLNPSISIPLPAVQAGVIMPSTVPPDANQSYTPINDTSTETNLPIFTPGVGSKTCNDMKALGNPSVFYDTYPVVGGAGTSYSSITGDLRASDETINNITSITGNVWATARTISTVSSITAGSSGVDLNAVNVGNVSSITSSSGHTSIVAHTISSIASFTGHLYASADSIGSLSSITTSQYLVLVNRGWVSSGTTGGTPLSMSSITSGNFLLCGFNVSSLSGITASFIGIANGSVVSNISSLSVGQFTVYGGTLGNISSATISNLTLYNTNVGNISSVSGNIQAYGGNINRVDNMSGQIDLYNGATITTVGASFSGTIINH